MDENAIATIGKKVLGSLIYCYIHDIPFYLSNTINYYFANEEDALFTSNEEVLDYVRKMLSDKYELSIESVQRIHHSEDEEREDFTYEDTQIQIKLKEND